MNERGTFSSELSVTLETASLVEFPCVSVLPGLRGFFCRVDLKWYCLRQVGELSRGSASQSDWVSARCRVVLPRPRAYLEVVGDCALNSYALDGLSG